MKTLSPNFKFQLLFIFTIILATISIAQTPEIDSLKTLIQEQNTNDSLQVDLMNETSGKLFRYDMNEALDFAKQAKSLAEEINYIHGKAESYKNIAFYHINKGNYDLSTDNYLQALSLYKKEGNKSREALCYNNIAIMQKIRGDIKTAIETNQKALKIRKDIDDKHGISSSLANIGNLHYSVSDYDSAIVYYKMAVKVNEEVGNLDIISKTLDNIGVTFQRKGDLSRAMDYHQKALAISEEDKNKRQTASCLLNIGVVYYYQEEYSMALEYYHKSLVISEELGAKDKIADLLNNIGIIHEHQKQYQKALDFHQKALKIKEEIGYKRGIAGTYNNMASIYKNQNEFHKALDYYSKAIEISKEIGSKESICKNMNMMGYVNLKLGNTLKAYQLNKEALKISEEIGGIVLIKECADILSQSAAAMGYYKEAYNYHVLFKNMADSMLNESNIKEITNLENQYNFEKEKQVIALEQQKEKAVLKAEAKRQKLQRNVFILGFVIVLIFGIIVFNFYRRINKINQKLVTQNAVILKQKEEKEMLVQEIHHRTKNNLQIISSLFDMQMRTTSNPDTKAALIDGLNRVKSVGLIHQLLYQSEDVININLKDFIQKLVNHISSFSSDKPILHEIEIPEDIQFDIKTTLPLGLIINELLTNAFKYAFEDVEQCSIFIKIKNQGKDNYQLELSDNGIGLPENYDFEHSKSLGLKLVRTLSEQLSGEISYVFDKGAKFLLTFNSKG